MGFTNEKMVEEILFEAHSSGLNDLLIEKVNELKNNSNSRLNNDIYLEAWKLIRQ
jgi:hypothetical protein